MTEFENPDSRKLVGFDVAWVEKWENFKLPTLIFFVQFFAICRELIKKINYPNKSRGYRPSKRVKSKQS